MGGSDGPTSSRTGTCSPPTARSHRGLPAAGLGLGLGLGGPAAGTRRLLPLSRRHNRHHRAALRFLWAGQPKPHRVVPGPQPQPGLNPGGRVLLSPTEMWGLAGLEGSLQEKDS